MKISIMYLDKKQYSWWLSHIESSVRITWKIEGTKEDNQTYQIQYNTFNIYFL